MASAVETTTVHAPAPIDVPGPKARAMVARDQAVFAPCAGRAYPFVIERGEGCYVWDVDGNRYLDLNAGIAVVAAGHSHPRIVQAIQDQATRFTHMAGTDFYNEPMIQLCEKIVALMPATAQQSQGSRPDWQVFLCNSGTEAVEGAIKMARYVTGRHGIIAFFGAFHGRSYGSLSLTAGNPKQRHGYYPLVPGTYHAFFPNPYNPPLGATPEQATEACLRYLEQTLLGTVVGPQDVAAIIVEPIQGEAGYIVPTPGFLRGLREICDRHGILLIADEVQSGVGRTGKMWAFEHEGIVPDIVASAKGLGGGMPVGAVIGQTHLMERWIAGTHGNTYGGNGVVCAAAYETLSLVEEELIANAAEVGAYLQSGLAELQRRYSCIGEVRGRGLMIGVEFKPEADAQPNRTALPLRVVEAAFRRGALLLLAGPDTIRFCPPLSLTKVQADEALAIFQAAIEDALA